MTDTFYRATLHLERVEPYDNLSERTTEMSAHTVTGATPADAMYQIHDHAGTLYDWHQDQTDELTPAPGSLTALTLDEANRRISDAFSQLSKATQNWLRPNPRQPGPADTGEQPLADWEADILAAEAANRAARAEERAHIERPFVACKAPADWAPGHFCRGPLGHDGPCAFVPADQLPASNADEGDDKDPTCVHCGEDISYINGSWRHDNGNKGHIADPGVVEGDAPPFVQVLQQPDEPHRALPGDLAQERLDEVEAARKAAMAKPAPIILTGF